MAAERRPFRRRILLNTAWSGVVTAWAMVVTIVTLPITLHGLGGGVRPVGAAQYLLGDDGVVLLGRSRRRCCGHRRHRRARGGRRPRGRGRVITSSIALFVGLGTAFGLVFAAVGPWVLPRLFDTAPDLVADLRVAIIVYAVQVVVDQASNGCQASLDGLRRADLSRLSDGAPPHPRGSGRGGRRRARR